jgi:aldose sugar dehydrogenase
MARRAMVLPLVAVLGVGCSGQPQGVAADERIESEQAAFHVIEVVPGLEHPWAVAFLPEGDMLITERPGRLRLVSGGELQPDPIAGVPEVWASGQGGLLDVALHPDFADNRLVYLSYSATVGGGQHTHVARGRLGEGTLEDVEVIFQAGPPASGGRHFGSRLVFDDEGYLFITIGDRGDAERAQDPSDHAGTVVRLHDDGRVPDDNPFAAGGEGAPEVYSYGHRNPQGMALHPETGRVWTHEHGPRGGDEINITEAGINFGWPVITYGVAYSGLPIGEGITEHPDMRSALYHWTPSIAPSGMAFYDGEAIAGWQGNLFVGALAGQHLARLELDGEQVVAEERLLENTIGRIRDVRSGPDGFLYLLTDHANGGLYRLEPAG